MLAKAQKVEKLVRSLGLELSRSRAAPKPYGGNMDCDEVYPNIFLGDGETAKQLPDLKSIGITHVVNTAMGSALCLVDTDEEFYKSSEINFFGFSISDLPGSDISVHFEPVANFIETALVSQGKVYVHCWMGISRSATCVIAFLMLKRGMTAEEALMTCRAKRNIHPNKGFLKQLAELDIKLQERRESGGTETKRCGMS